jgi:hypothetical protein
MTSPDPDDATAGAPTRAAADGTVRLEDPERMNLLGLLLRSILERRLAEPAARRRAARLRGEVAVRGGRMRVTLRFEPTGIVITRAASARPRARVEGTLAGLLAVALGRGLVRPLLTRALAPRGNLLFLLRLLPLLRGRPA